VEDGSQNWDAARVGPPVSKDLVPPCPRVALRICAPWSTDPSHVRPAEQLAARFSRDACAGRRGLLRIAKQFSAFGSKNGKIATISRALTVLGVRQVARF